MSCSLFYLAVKHFQRQRNWLCWLCHYLEPLVQCFNWVVIFIAVISVTFLTLYYDLDVCWISVPCKQVPTLHKYVSNILAVNAKLELSVLWIHRPPWPTFTVYCLYKRKRGICIVWPLASICPCHHRYASPTQGNKIMFYLSYQTFYVFYLIYYYCYCCC